MNVLSQLKQQKYKQTIVGFVVLAVHQSINQLINQPTNQSINQSDSSSH